MSTPLSKITKVLNTLKSTEVVFANENIPISHSVLAVDQLSIFLTRDLEVIEDTTDETKFAVNDNLSQRECYLAGLYAYRNYISQEHHGMAQKAVNFKTINFAVTGLTERAKEMMRILWWCGDEIKKTENSFTEIMGASSEMRGRAYEE